MNQDISRVLDRLEIRDLLDNWVVWRDSGDFERLSTLWHDDARIVTTWCEVGAQEFMALSKKAWASGAINARHTHGGTNIEIAGDRAVAQTKMTLTQRGSLHDVLVDVTCAGRFYDLLQRRDGRWAISLRHPIYEGDRIDAVDPASSLALDRALLDELPAHYRHLAYLQTALGLKVNRHLPGKVGPEVERLLALGSTWLAGGALDLTTLRT
jgi:ketosteroid isomerase-like protein